MYDDAKEIFEGIPRRLENSPAVDTGSPIASRKRRATTEAPEMETQGGEAEVASGAGAAGSVALQRPVKRQRRSSGIAIADAHLAVKDAAINNEPEMVKVHRAIDLLDKDYGDELDSTAFIAGVGVLENPVKAVVFLALRRRSIRDRWLNGEITKALAS
jgi:hypothetical protein